MERLFRAKEENYRSLFGPKAKIGKGEQNPQGYGPCIENQAFLYIIARSHGKGKSQEEALSRAELAPDPRHRQNEEVRADAQKAALKCTEEHLDSLRRHI